VTSASLTVHGFGACSPTPCDWVQTPGVAYGDTVSSAAADAFTATYAFGFKTTVLAGTVSNGLLTVDNFNHIAAGDTRSSYRRTSRGTLPR
jgi:hypothetical protein